MSHPVKLLIPKDVLEVVDSVCPKRGRTRCTTCLPHIRAKLAWSSPPHNALQEGTGRSHH